MNSCFSSGLREGPLDNETRKTIIWHFHQLHFTLALLFQNEYIKCPPPFFPCELAVASTHCGLKAPSETCDVWRGDILAGIQLIVHQSGRSAVMLLNWLYSRQMTTAAMPFKTSETTSRHHV